MSDAPWKPTGPFCLQPKSALRRIRDAYDGRGGLSYALAVYVVLTEFASDAQSPSFERRRREIAERSGASLRTVAEVLNILKRIELVDWEQNRGDGEYPLGASRYSLPCAQGAYPCARYEETSCAQSIEESLEESPKKGRADGAAPASSSSPEEWLRALEADPTYQGINVRRLFGKMLTWCEANGKQPTKRRFVNWLNREDLPLALPQQPRNEIPILT